MEETLEELRAEKEKLIAEKEELIEQLTNANENLALARETIARAKDPTPVVRPSPRRVQILVECSRNGMRLTRTPAGWLLSFGNKLQRLFKRLIDIWEIFVKEDWHLSDIFQPPPPKRKAIFAPKLPLRGQVLLPSMAVLVADTLNSLGGAMMLSHGNLKKPPAPE